MVHDDMISKDNIQEYITQNLEALQTVNIATLSVHTRPSTPRAMQKARHQQNLPIKQLRTSLITFQSEIRL
ncbi:hypothetical protein E4U52_001710 [Claviceps spartinae]|nr:hypothetical protein E4U52_001710 [Claviceps spartinae]